MLRFGKFLGSLNTKVKGIMLPYDVDPVPLAKKSKKPFSGKGKEEK